MVITKFGLPCTYNRVCKPAYLVPVPSQDWKGCARKGIQRKNGGMAEMGHQLVWKGWQSIWIVGVSACVIFILHQKIQKMAKSTFWYQLTQVVLDKVQRAVKCLCVCVCARTCVCDCLTWQICSVISPPKETKEIFAQKYHFDVFQAYTARQSIHKQVLKVI